MEGNHGVWLAIIPIIVAIITLIISVIGVIVIPILIAKGKIRPGISPIESLKFEIISEMYKSRSRGYIYCGIDKIRDTIFQKRKPRKEKSPSLEYLLQFDQALIELDMEKRILRVGTVDISMAEAGKIEEKEVVEEYQSPYSDTIKQYAIVEESHLRYAIIPTRDLYERIMKKRGILAEKGL